MIAVIIKNSLSLFDSLCYIQGMDPTTPDPRLREVPRHAQYSAAGTVRQEKKSQMSWATEFGQAA